MYSSSNTFGLMVAYLLPGFIGLAGIAPFNPLIAAWLHAGDQVQAGLGPPVYAVLAATTFGLIASCFRWLIIDHIHQWTDLKPPMWNDSRLEQHLSAFHYLVESHYRYYQFVANTLIAVIWAYAINRWMGTSSFLGFGTDLGMVVLCSALFAASRDALTKYYTCTSQLIGTAGKDFTGNNMYNGNHSDGGSKSEGSRPEAKSEIKPAPAPAPKPTPEDAKRTPTPK